MATLRSELAAIGKGSDPGRIVGRIAIHRWRMQEWLGPRRSRNQKTGGPETAPQSSMSHIALVPPPSDSDYQRKGMSPLLAGIRKK